MNNYITSDEIDKEKLYKCCICEQEYKESNIIPFNYYEKELNKWSKITRITYQDKHLPLCSEHLRMLLLCNAINKNEPID